MHEQRKNFKCSFVSKTSRLIKYRPSFYSLVYCCWPVLHSLLNDRPNGSIQIASWEWPDGICVNKHSVLYSFPFFFLLLYFSIRIQTTIFKFWPSFAVNIEQNSMWILVIQKIFFWNLRNHNINVFHSEIELNWIEWNGIGMEWNAFEIYLVYSLCYCTIKNWM